MENLLFLQRKRGRPSKRDLEKEPLDAGAVSHICPHCMRSFSKKSLRNHLRIHEGAAPYMCDYPKCNRSFRQSGHLKTHEKLHTREKPFACPVEGCNVRFTHQSRQCKDHPEEKLKRDGKGMVQFNENHTPEEREWLIKYEKNKGMPVKRKKALDTSATDSQSESSQSYSVKRASKKCKTSSKSDVDTLDLNSSLSPARPDTLPHDRSPMPFSFASSWLQRQYLIEKFDSIGQDVPVSFPDSSSSSPARADTFPGDISDRSSESVENFKTSTPKHWTSSSSILQNFDCNFSPPTRPDSFSTDVRDRCPEFSTGIHTSVIIGRSEILDQKTVRFSDKNGANPSPTQNANHNSDPKPIRTPVIQSINIRVEEADPVTLDAAETLVFLSTAHPIHSEQN